MSTTHSILSTINPSLTVNNMVDKVHSHSGGTQHTPGPNGFVYAISQQGSSTLKSSEKAKICWTGYEIAQPNFEVKSFFTGLLCDVSSTGQALFTCIQLDHDLVGDVHPFKYGFVIPHVYNDKLFVYFCASGELVECDKKFLRISSGIIGIQPLSNRPAVMLNYSSSPSLCVEFKCSGSASSLVLSNVGDEIYQEIAVTIFAVACKLAAKAGVVAFVPVADLDETYDTKWTFFERIVAAGSQIRIASTVTGQYILKPQNTSGYATLSATSQLNSRDEQNAIFYGSGPDLFSTAAETLKLSYAPYSESAGTYKLGLAATSFFSWVYDSISEGVSRFSIIGDIDNDTSDETTDFYLVRQNGGCKVQAESLVTSKGNLSFSGAKSVGSKPTQYTGVLGTLNYLDTVTAQTSLFLDSGKEKNRDSVVCVGKPFYSAVYFAKLHDGGATRDSLSEDVSISVLLGSELDISEGFVSDGDAGVRYGANFASLKRYRSNKYTAQLEDAGLNTFYVRSAGMYLKEDATPTGLLVADQADANVYSLNYDAATKTFELDGSDLVASGTKFSVDAFGSLVAYDEVNDRFVRLMYFNDGSDNVLALDSDGGNLTDLPNPYFQPLVAGRDTQTLVLNNTLFAAERPLKKSAVVESTCAIYSVKMASESPYLSATFRGPTATYQKLHNAAVPPGSSAVDIADVTGLLSGGKIDSALLPSYVDDVLMYASFASFPGTGEAGKIYVTEDTNLSYRWSGAAYIAVNDMSAYATLASPTFTTQIATPQVRIAGDLGTRLYQSAGGELLVDSSTLLPGFGYNVCKFDSQGIKIGNSRSIYSPFYTSEVSFMDMMPNSAAVNNTYVRIRGHGGSKSNFLTAKSIGAGFSSKGGVVFGTSSASFAYQASPAGNMEIAYSAVDCETYDPAVATPIVRFGIDGTLRQMTTGVFRSSDGLVTAPAYSFESSNAAGMYLSGPNTIAFGVNSIARCTIGSGGLRMLMGSGLMYEEGDPTSRGGQATLVLGTVTVVCPYITTANHRIFLTVQNVSGSEYGLVRVSARVNSTSFTITSYRGNNTAAVATGDTSTVAWMVVGV